MRPQTVSSCAVLSVFSIVAILAVLPAAATAGDSFSDMPAVPAAASTDSATTIGPPIDESLLGWVYRSLGLGYSGVFLALSIVLVTLFIMNSLAARRSNVTPMTFIDEFQSHLHQRQYQEAYQCARRDASILGRVLAAGLAKLSRGYDRALETMQEVGEEEAVKLQQRLSYLALVGSLAPMIGLLGTVHGMIASFSVIASQPTTPPPWQLAGGISTALFTTLLGLAIAIPAIAGYNILRNRINRLVLEMGILSESLIERFSDVRQGR